jgi:hypothetical protein
MSESRGRVDPAEPVDAESLRIAVRRVLAEHPASTARQVLAALPDELMRRVVRRDVNSVLYRGAGKEFIRSDDVKPSWRLRDTIGGVAPDAGDIARILFED